MEKLILAQDTSNVDDTGMSSEDIRERDKKRRRKKAKRKVSSSSEDEEELVANKENRRIPNNTLPPFPQIEKFVSSSTPLKVISTQHIENMTCDDILTSVVSNNNTNTSINTIL